MVIRVLWTVLAAKEDTVSSVAYYIPIDQRQADELRHSADASAWAEERLEEAVLNGASIIDDQQWMGMYFALRQLPQAQVTPELPQAATGIEQLGEEPPVVLVPAEAVSAIADALSGVGAEELETAAENVRAEYPDVLLDDAATVGPHASFPWLLLTVLLGASAVVMPRLARHTPQAQVSAVQH